MGEYLTFTRLNLAGRKTSLWQVHSKRNGALLGDIKWFGRWRQFAFFPATATVFNPECMRDIIGQIDRAASERRAALAREEKR